MKNPSKISHPLKNRTGSSQRTRIKQALKFDSAPIDGKTLADRLYLISEYAQQINFYAYNKNAIENQELTNWVSFFKNSLPFRLAILSKASIDDLESEYNLLVEALKINPSNQALESLLEFVFNKIITPVTVLFNTVDKAENSFTIPLSTLIRSTFVAPLKSFISLYNSSVTFLCIGKKNFAGYMTSPWLLKVDEVYALDLSIQQVTKGKKEAFLKADNILNTLFYQMLSGLDSIIKIAPDYIEESLMPLEESLQKKHEPHLALLFTFLELFKHFQGNINQLGKKHLDFFYEKVLRMIPKEAVPDKAHIVFEVAKHLDAYPLPKDLLLKDGKDLNKQDIRFGLDHEIILDKAKVTDLRTFSVYPAENDSELIEGVYIASIANSVDGKGKKFKEDAPNNWATLGSKYSKAFKEVAGGDPVAENQPHARLGFVLASPVLLLQEGNRTINFILECGSNIEFIEKIKGIYDTEIVYEIPANIFESFNNVLPELIEGDSDEVKQEKIEFRIVANEFFKELLIKKVNNILYKKEFDAFLLVKNPKDASDFFSDDIQVSITELFSDFESTARVINISLFKFKFSGEKEWLTPKDENTVIFVSSTATRFKFEIQIELDKDFPAVTFFNEKNLKESIDLKKSQPVVKIELNESIKIDCDIDDAIQDCCLTKRTNTSLASISPYSFFRNLILFEASIKVKACGVKNLIVQNDEGTLDINSQIFPFGLRPDVPGFDPMNQLDLSEEAPELNEDSLSLLGPSFYIGSKEILYKKWNCVRVNLEWKEKPESFHDYYKAYLKKKNIEGPFNIENLGLEEDNFKLKIDELNDGKWISALPELIPTIPSKTELFSKISEDFCESKLNCDTTIYGWEIKNVSSDRFVDYNEPLDFFKNSLNGFLRFTLADQDFLHKEYPFVLARQMLAYALLAQGELLTDAIYVSSNKTVIQASTDNKLDSNTKADIAGALIAAQSLKSEIESLGIFITDHRGGIDTIINNISDVIDQAATYMATEFPPFKAALEDFFDTKLSPSSFTLSEFVDALFDIRNDIQGLNNSILIEELITNTFTPFIQSLLDILKKPDGLKGIVEMVLININDTTITPADKLGIIKGPIEDIQEGIDDVIKLINDTNNDQIAEGILAKLNTIKGIIGSIETYITANFNKVLDDLKLLVEQLDEDMLALAGSLTTRSLTTISKQLIEYNEQLEEFVGSDTANGSLIFEFDKFVSTILLTIIDENREDDLTDLAIQVEEAVNNLDEIFVQTNILDFLNNNALQSLIPTEPWTPTIKNLYIDYSASAEKEDMDIIHLYPYENTSKHENIQSNPTLFPFYDTEGTLFIGIEEVTVGGSLSILFQLAEATADSELDRAKIEWFYLTDNTWIKLRPDFDVISDETDGLTVSGIVTIAVPDDIKKEGNTQMPDDKYWIKVIAAINTKAVAETIGIHTQAAKTSARLNKLNDRNRLETPLEAGGIAKLVDGDFSVKKVEQLYASFGGKTPEAGGHFYTRVSEHLKHKGRALMINDYEKIVLEGFPEIYKAKSISHTMGLSAHTYRRDLEIAPGYIVVTVIPDLTKLKAGNQLEPKVPLSLLEKIADHIRSKTSPFARLKVMNPRFEYVDVSIAVRLYRGKSSNFYKQKLKEDLTLFLAPWFLGDSEKLAFGQNVIFSDVVGFVEQLDYVDFISNLQLKGACDQTGSIIKPLTARSVLTAGKMCVNINEESCPGQNTNHDESCFETLDEEGFLKPESINKLSESM